MIKLGVPLLVLFSGGVFGANESVFLGHGKQHEIPTPSFSERQCGSIICKDSELRYKPYRQSVTYLKRAE